MDDTLLKISERYDTQSVAGFFAAAPTPDQKTGFACFSHICFCTGSWNLGKSGVDRKNIVLMALPGRQGLPQLEGRWVGSVAG